MMTTQATSGTCDECHHNAGWHNVRCSHFTISNPGSALLAELELEEELSRFFRWENLAREFDRAVLELNPRTRTGSAGMPFEASETVFVEWRKTRVQVRIGRQAVAVAHDEAAHRLSSWLLRPVGKPPRPTMPRLKTLAAEALDALYKAPCPHLGEWRQAHEYAKPAASCEEWLRFGADDSIRIISVCQDCGATIDESRR